MAADEIERSRNVIASDVHAAASPSTCAAFVSCLHLSVLALGAFSFGTYEFLLTGLYNYTAETWDLDASQVTDATLVFMIVGSISPLLMALFPPHLNNKWLLMALQLVLASASVASALAPSFWVLLVARGFAAFAHSPYTSLGMTQAVMLGRGKPPQSVAHFFSGWTLANVVGIPFCTYLGDQLGDWRHAYWPIVGVAGLSSILIALLPKRNVPKNKVNVVEIWAAWKRPSLWGALVVLMFGYGGVFGCHTFYDYIMTDLAGYSQGQMPWLAVGWGLAVAAGNYIGGFLADKSVLLPIAVCMPLLAAVLGLFSFFADNQIAATALLMLNGLVGFSMVTPLMQYMSARTAGLPLVKAENTATGPDGGEEQEAKDDAAQAVTQAQAGFGYAIGMSAMGTGIIANVVASQQLIPVAWLGYATANLVGAATAGAGALLFFILEGKSLLAECRAITGRERQRALMTALLSEPGTARPTIHIGEVSAV
jgi:DHA1 family inner membrane transport protein